MRRMPLDRDLSAPGETRAHLVKNWGDFLSTIHWQFFATATFARPVSAAYSLYAARQWVESLSESAYAFIGHERGTIGERVHCHALLGGVFSRPRRDGHPTDRLLATERVRLAWTHGDIQVDAYDPRRAAALYIAKCPDDADVIGNWQRHQPRRLR
jgi:hypothetical protein